MFVAPFMCREVGMLCKSRVIALFVVLVLVVCQQAVWATDPGVPQSSQVLSRDEVDALIKEMDRAIDEKSVKIMDPLLDESLKVTLKHVPLPDGKTGDMDMTKNQYLAVAQQAWAAAKSYEYRRTDLQIEMAKDSKSAAVSAIVHEKVVLPDQKIESKTRETVTVEKREGKAVVTVIDGEILEMK